MSGVTPGWLRCSDYGLHAWGVSRMYDGPKVTVAGRRDTGLAPRCSETGLPGGREAKRAIAIDGRKNRYG